MLETLLKATPEQGAAVLKRGGVLVFPTETVYGIGASGYLTESLQEIYRIKNRPQDNPLIFHYKNLESIQKDCELDKKAQAALEQFSPGPLTLVLKKKKKDLFPKSRDTLAVRIPRHRETKKLLDLLDFPIAAPSANISGKPSITNYEMAVKVFLGKVDAILWGQEPEFGMESTVIDFSGSNPRLLRFGSLDLNELVTFLPELEIPFRLKDGLIEPNSKKNFLSETEKEAEPLSPGMKYRHYSPEAPVALVPWKAEVKLQEGEAFFGSNPPIDSSRFQKLVRSNREYMKELYRFLNDCDSQKITKIYLELPNPDEDYKELLLDRLRKIVSQE